MTIASPQASLILVAFSKLRTATIEDLIVPPIFQKRQPRRARDFKFIKD
nr:hypothetical protein [Borrelia sp. CA_690]